MFSAFLVSCLWYCLYNNTASQLKLGGELIQGLTAAFVDLLSIIYFC